MKEQLAAVRRVTDQRVHSIYYQAVTVVSLKGDASMLKITKNLIGAGLGLLFLSCALLGLVATLVLATPKEHTVGKALLNAMTNTQPASEFRDDAPELIKDLAALEDPMAHPLIVDMRARQVEEFGIPLTFIDLIQYRNYVLLDFAGPGDEYYSYVYQWDGEVWVFVESRCYTC